MKAYWSPIIAVVFEKMSSGMMDLQGGEVTVWAALMYELGPT